MFTEAFIDIEFFYVIFLTQQNYMYSGSAKLWVCVLYWMFDDLIILKLKYYISTMNIKKI